jgi:hypothetical protein
LWGVLTRYSIFGNKRHNLNLHSWLCTKAAGIGEGVGALSRVLAVTAISENGAELVEIT